MTYPQQAQPGTGFPDYSGLPVQEIPGAIYTQPNQVSQETQFPPEVIAAAQSASLGRPTREYRKSATNSHPLAIGVQSIMRMTLISVGVTMLIVMAYVLFVAPAPFNYLSAGITVISILPFIPMLLKFTRNIGGSSGDSALVAWSCPEGLVYMQNKQLNTLRWDQVRKIWRKLGMLNGMLTTLAYVVEPTNAAPFSFSLLNGPFADYMLRGNDGGSLSVSFAGGEISNNGGFIQISGNYSLTEYAGLGDLIEEQVTECALPGVLEAYHSGHAIHFGSFVLHQQGMSDGLRELAWHEIGQVQISVAGIQITKKAIGTIWFNLSASTLPNCALLCAVLHTIREK
jgi:hypothetical protein